MTDFSAHAKVGLVVIVSILMLVGGLNMLDRSVKGNVINITITFDEARGLSRGVDVRVAGVVAGSVSLVVYDPDRDLAVVHVKMKKEARFPKDSAFIAMSEGLVGEKVINVQVPEKSNAGWVEDGDEFEGKFDDGLDQLILKGNKTMDEINDMLSKASEKLDTEFLNEIIYDITGSVKDTLDHVNSLLIHLDSIIGSNSDEINATLINMEEMTGNFKLVSEDVKRITQNPEIIERLDKMSNELDASLSSLRRISEDIEEITNDPEIKAGVKNAVKLTNEVLEEAKGTMGEIRGTLSNVEDKFADIEKLTDIDVSGRLTGRFINNSNPKQGQDENLALADVEVKMATQKGFIQVGVDGIGEESELNLQGGRVVNNDLSLRGGIIRGKIGAGLDYDIGNSVWSIDGYNPNDLKMNSYLRFKLGDDYSIKVGAEDIFGDTNFSAGVAIEF